MFICKSIILIGWPKYTTFSIIFLKEFIPKIIYNSYYSNFEYTTMALCEKKKANNQ